MRSKRPSMGKRGKRDRNSVEIWNCRQNHVNSEKLELSDVELQKWRSNRMSYLKSRVSHIHLKWYGKVN